MKKNLRLTRKDYETVLNFYNVSYKKTDKLKQIKQKGEKILSDKLCRCIKKVTKKLNSKNENRPIAICKKSILLSKGITDINFKCRNKRSITLKKRNLNNKKTLRNNKSLRNKKTLRNK